jgi:hypothetical protein
MNRKDAESLDSVLNRLIRSSPTQRATLAVRPGPAGLHHEVPPCDMSASDKAFIASSVRLWCTCAEIALMIADILTLQAVKQDALDKSILNLDLLSEDKRLREHLPVRRKIVRYREAVEDYAERSAMPPETRQKLVRDLCRLLDFMKTYDPLIDAVTRYCAKLNLAVLGIERINDACEAIRFAREVAAEVAVG